MKLKTLVDNRAMNHETHQRAHAPKRRAGASIGGRGLAAGASIGYDKFSWALGDYW